MFPSPGDFPNPAIEAGSPVLQADSLPSKSLHYHFGLNYFCSIMFVYKIALEYRDTSFLWSKG